MNGVMTYLLTKIIREHSGITYVGLLEKLQEEIGMVHRSKHLNGILKRIFHRRIEQVSSYPFTHNTINECIFTLPNNIKDFRESLKHLT